MTDKKLWGRKVFTLEKRLGMPLEDVLQRMEHEGLSYREQGNTLGVSAQTILLWRHKAGITKRSTDEETVLRRCGLEYKEDK